MTMCSITLPSSMWTFGSLKSGNATTATSDLAPSYFFFLISRDTRKDSIYFFIKWFKMLWWGISRVFWLVWGLWILKKTKKKKTLWYIDAQEVYFEKCWVPNLRLIPIFSGHTSKVGKKIMFFFFYKINFCFILCTRHVFKYLEMYCPLSSTSCYFFFGSMSIPSS